MDSQLASSFPVDLPKGDNKISLYYKKLSNPIKEPLFQRQNINVSPVCESLLTSFSILSHPFPIPLTRVTHSFLTCCASFTHAYKVSLIMMRHKFHREETLVSSRWDTSFITMRLIKDTDKKDARRMRKEWGTGEKGMGYRWERKRKPIRQRAQTGFKGSYLYTELTITDVGDNLTSNVNLMLYPLCRFKNYPYFCRT